MIALFCATPREESALLAAMRWTEEKTAPRGARLHIAGRSGREYVICTTGVGKVSAASSTRHVLDRFPVEAAITLGTAGSLSPLLRVGDLVIAEDTVAGDCGISHSEGFGHTGPLQVGERGFSSHPLFPSAPFLVKAALSAARRAGIPHRAGRLFSCDQVILDPGLRSKLGRDFDVLAVDMESAAVAQVAETDGVPFLAVRCISDGIAQDLPGLEKLFPVGSASRVNLWGRRFRLMITHPSTLLRARELSRGTAVAVSVVTEYLPPLLDELG